VRPSYLALAGTGAEDGPAAKGCRCNYQHLLPVEVLIYVKTKVAIATIVTVALSIARDGDAPLIWRNDLPSKAGIMAHSFRRPEDFR
jgi:hypothetical protein